MTKDRSDSDIYQKSVYRKKKIKRQSIARNLKCILHNYLRNLNVFK